jgi:bifunctional non-homologous end joining protein LigD
MQADRAPRGEAWLHEVKFDGYRFQCHIQKGVRFYTRRGYDWSNRLQHLVGAVQPLNAHAIILDGEVIVQTPEGRPIFMPWKKR